MARLLVSATEEGIIYSYYKARTVMFGKIGVFVLIFFLATSGSLTAQILNGGFELALDDSNSPWQIDPGGVAPEILASFSTLEHGSSEPNVMLYPVEGQYFVVLQSDDEGGFNDPNYSRLSQRITLEANQTITGAFFFSTSDWIPYNDTATIKLIPDPCSSRAEITLAYMDVNSVLSYGAMEGWETFSHSITEAEAGSYLLVLNIIDATDNKYPSYMSVDGLRILPAPGCHYAIVGDLNGDCKVDFLDFAIMATNWLIDCSSAPEDPACVSE